MGRALVEGSLKSDLVKPEDTYVYSRTPYARETIQNELGVQVVESNVEVAAKADIVLLCTKPHDIPLVLLELSNEAECLTNTLLVSTAAGLTIAQLDTLIPPDVRLVR